MTSRLPFIVSRTGLHVMCDLFVTIPRCFHVVSLCVRVSLYSSGSVYCCAVMVYSYDVQCSAAVFWRVYQSSRINYYTTLCTYAVGSVICVCLLLFYAMQNWLTQCLKVLCCSITLGHLNFASGYILCFRHICFIFACFCHHRDFTFVHSF